ncbi:hypothetical protein [Sporolactobacillus pectinivorans]|uniref:hypothetical protein n=1 Tax=Sporolactobacillus pectinivorans TaxID=1591408 RepID=UPI000C261B12|nr:hypothetical protein [Sporolactobacillus pectinivorans]
MSKPYVLNKKAAIEVLTSLNGFEGSEAINRALEKSNKWPNLEEIEDWIEALKTGREIINPITPKEEFIDAFNSDVGEEKWDRGFNQGMKTAIEIISKAYPDVADWLKEGDTDD